MSICFVYVSCVRARQPRSACQWIERKWKKTRAVYAFAIDTNWEQHMGSPDNLWFFNLLHSNGKNWYIFFICFYCFCVYVFVCMCVRDLFCYPIGAFWMYAKTSINENFEKTKRKCFFSISSSFHHAFETGRAAFKSVYLKRCSRNKP